MSHVRPMLLVLGAMALLAFTACTSGTNGTIAVPAPTPAILSTTAAPPQRAATLPGAFVLTVTVTGTGIGGGGGGGQASTIDWGIGESQHTDNVPLPWTVVVNPKPGSHSSPALQASLVPGAVGTIRCTVTRDGQELATDTGTISVLCAPQYLVNQ
ncbi:hypothetical protein AB0F91_33100 [Amycolatopsis sp. NPDC023774]|uniref:hypothetical protein n=1 Tax=Amycolatopsis sp. NPDC023774 TaxID=3155015 RepID=UPI0033CC57BB